MARLKLCVNFEDYELAANAWKTAAAIKAPANQMVAITNLWVSMNGVAGDAEHAKVRLRRIQAGTGTGTTVTPAKVDNTRTATPQSTARVNFTVEPTDDGDLTLYPHKVHPQGASSKDTTFSDVVLKEGTEIALQIKLPNGATAVKTDGHVEIEE